MAGDFGNVHLARNLFSVYPDLAGTADQTNNQTARVREIKSQRRKSPRFRDPRLAVRAGTESPLSRIDIGIMRKHLAAQDARGKILVPNFGSGDFLNVRLFARV